MVRPVRSDSGGSKAPERDQRENSLVRTFREVRSEMKKVVWPSREETLRLTVIVILVSLAMSLILFAADSLFQTLYTLLLSAVQG